MTDLLQLGAAFLGVLLIAYAPGYLVVRAAAGSRGLALALAPALGACIAGVGAIAAQGVGLRWSLPVLIVLSAAAIALAGGLARLGFALPSTVLDAPWSALGRRAQLAWSGILAGALLLAVGPIAARAGRADAVLERYDTLFHLTALAYIRETGQASSLTLNAVASPARSPASYPAAFHDLVALIPGIDIPILLNGATLALAVVPWALGAALLARVALPRTPWAPPACAAIAIVIPASPLDLWIHLSPIPNLVGFAFLGGALAGAAALWESCTGTVPPADGSSPVEAEAAPSRAATAPARTAPTRTAPARTAQIRTVPVRTAPIRTAVAATGMIAAAGAGLTLLQPNVGVTALLAVAVLTAVTGLPHWRTRPLLAIVPLLALAPIAALVLTPLGARVTGFTGGLRVPWYTALGEVGLGLWTVWPMALGVCLAVLWWPGLVRAARTPRIRWIAALWGVLVVLYLDAAVDSPLNLSVLYFRGQDRIAVPLALVSALLVIPGLQAWARRLRLVGEDAEPLSAATRAVLVLTAVAVALSSVPPRLDNAALNLDAEYAGRGRFLQADEVARFTEVADQLDPDATILASPYSGASHMYALLGLRAYVPVAGAVLTAPDRAAIDAVPEAGSSPAACRALRDRGIDYVYQESILYQRDTTFSPIGWGGDDLGPVVFETSHSRLIRVECDPGA